MKIPLQKATLKFKMLFILFFIFHYNTFAHYKEIIAEPHVTISTLPLPATNIQQGANKQPIYAFQMNAEDPFQLEYIFFKSSGTYNTTDFVDFNLYSNTTNSLETAELIGYFYTSPVTGAGQVLKLGGTNTPIPIGTKYYWITGRLSETAVDGNTIKINGADTEVVIDGYLSTPTITNNQSDIAGTQTIRAPHVTINTIALPASNILQGANKQPIYAFQMNAEDPFQLEYIFFKSSGTYNTTDFVDFNLYSNTTNSLETAELIGYFYTSPVTGAGQVLKLGGTNTPIPIGTKYYWITGRLSETAVDGNTIKINGADTQVFIDGFNSTPSITNNQTNIAGKQTIGAPTYTASTENIPAKIIARGTDNHPFYILKVQTGSVGGTITNLKINTAGTYDNNDISSFTLYQNNTPSATGATQIASDNTSTGHGETLDFNTGYLEIDANTTTYLIVEANISAMGTALNTFQIIGNTNALVITNSGLAATLVNNQTNLAGIQTIGIPPTFATLSNITQNTEVNLCAAIVNYTASATGSPTPTYSYILTGATLGSGAGTGSGLVYNKGVTTVQLTATNSVSPDAVSSFTVTISDAQNPTITAPAAVSAFTNTACTATGVVLGTPVTSDNCSVASITNNAPSAFPKGETIVIWTVKDADGNETTANQTVTVVDNIPPTITAPLAITFPVFANNACVALVDDVSKYGTPIASDNCGNVSIVISGGGLFLPLGERTITYTAYDGNGNSATATQIVTVVDNVKPTITAPASVAANTNSGCTATSVDLGTPTTSDNCTVVSVTNNAPTAFPLGATTVIWTVTDGAGLTETATQIVTVTDNVPPTITAPAAISTFTNNSCTATGVVLGSPVTSDNCSVVSTTNNAPTAFPLGSTTVIWTVTDGAGLTATATQIVTITDNVPPTITAPASISAFTNAACTATGVVLGAPVTSDNCSVVSTTNNAPTVFPLGSTTVIWTVTDGAGLTATATQIVTVTDNVPPTITAPASVSAFTNAACTATGVVLGSAITYDNCSVVSTTNNAPTAFPLGSTTVIWTVSDGAGLTATATQVVTVTDNIPPTITAPADITTSTIIGCNISNIVLGTPSTADNCTVATVNNNAPSIYPIGLTNVIWTVTDGAGNTNTAIQKVTILGFTPTINTLDNTIITAIDQPLNLQSTIVSNFTKEWYFAKLGGSSVKIANENGESIALTPQATGSYTLKLIDQNLCSAVSNKINVKVQFTISGAGGTAAGVNIDNTYTEGALEYGVSSNCGGGLQYRIPENGPITYFDAGTHFYSLLGTANDGCGGVNGIFVYRENNIWGIYYHYKTSSGPNATYHFDRLYHTKNPFPTIPGARFSATNNTNTVPPANAVWINDATSAEVNLALNGATETQTTLPVSLISFTGKATENGNQLIWKTANEKAFSHFEIQKSVDAKKFEKIGEVIGNNGENYEFIDNSSLISHHSLLNFYRLKMVDIDGSFTYSKIVNIENSFEETVVGNIYPNPALNNEVFIDIQAIEAGNWSMKSYDITGKLLNTETKYLQKGINKVKVDLGNGGFGNRYIQIEGRGVLEVRKVVK